MTIRPRLVPPGDPAAGLNRQRRAVERDALASGRAVDVLVIGGGITGAGVALDAASRGLTVALVEAEDLAHGTSRWSSKLVHGGLRYLAKGEVAVAWESAQERALVAGRIAPHLVRRMPQVIPVFSGSKTGSYVSRIGFAAGDAMRIAARTPRGLLPGARMIGPDLTLRLAPATKTEGLTGGVVGWDCQLEDDARLVVAVARTAARFGAQVLTRVRAVDVGDNGAVVEDLLDGGRFEIRAGTVVNATGVWAGHLDTSIRLRPSLGTHVVVRSRSLGNPRAALTVPVPGHFGRFVFALPQPDGLCYIGLTDNPAAEPIPDVPTPPESDIRWIAEVISTGLAQPLTMADVVGSYAGLRPLVTSDDDAGAGGGDGSDSSDISRRHLVRRSGTMITVTGGKLTTYRRMAADVVDLITDTACRTPYLALVGAGPRPARSDIPARLWRRYGTEAPLVWALGAQDPNLRKPVAAQLPVLGVEFAFARDHELALTADDLIQRRTRLGLVPVDAAAAEPAAAAVMSGQDPPASD